MSACLRFDAAASDPFAATGEADALGGPARPALLAWVLAVHAAIGWALLEVTQPVPALKAPEPMIVEWAPATPTEPTPPAQDTLPVDPAPPRAAPLRPPETTPRATIRATAARTQTPTPSLTPAALTPAALTPAPVHEQNREPPPEVVPPTTPQAETPPPVVTPQQPPVDPATAAVPVPKAATGSMATTETAQTPAPAPSPPVPAAPAPLPTLPATAIRYRLPPAPDYPPTARRLGEHGTVVLRVVVDERGLPRQVSVHRGSGHARLDDAALAAMREARFVPRTDQGRPVAWAVLAPMTFELEN